MLRKERKKVLKRKQRQRTNEQRVERKNEIANGQTDKYEQRSIASMKTTDQEIKEYQHKERGKKRTERNKENNLTGCDDLMEENQNVTLLRTY